MADYESRIMLKQKKNADAAASQGRFGAQMSQDLRDRPADTSGAAASSSGVNTGSSNSDPEDEDFDRKKTVIFWATPEVQEVGTANWVEYSELRGPSSITFYMGSPSRTFSINAKFISRTKKEADLTFKYLNVLRSWRMPYIEDGWTGQAEPEVLHLFGYGNIFRGIPVILKSLNIDLNSEVDYIKSSNNSDIPIVCPVSLSLQEIHTLSDFEKFNIKDFKNGTLGWW